MISGTREIVEKLLWNHPHLRDDDNKLLATVYWHRASVLDFDGIELEVIKRFLQVLADGDLPNFESIGRCRRKLQEESEFLRGELYNERHKNQERVKEDLRLW